MKSYTETERQEHLAAWKNGNLSKAAYAKSAGIYPTTFYSWTRGTFGKTEQGFVEINKQIIQKNKEEIVIEKGTIIIRVPLSADRQELEKVFNVLEEAK